MNLFLVSHNSMSNPRRLSNKDNQVSVLNQLLGDRSYSRIRNRSEG